MMGFLLMTANRDVPESIWLNRISACQYSKNSLQDCFSCREFFIKRIMGYQAFSLSLKATRRILPFTVLGSSVINSTIRGYLYGAVWVFTYS